MRLGGGRTGKRAVICEQVELENLTFPFDLEIWYGDRVAVLGANGTGKSHFLRLLARGGRMSLLGLPDGPVTLDLNDQVIFKEARILGITGRQMFRTWQQTTTLLSTGRVDISPVITHRFPLDRYSEAFETAASGHAAKVIVFPGANDQR